MLELLIYLTGLVILVAAFFAYQRSRDPLGPMIIFAPMLLYLYVYRPLGLLYSGELQTLFPDLQRLELVQGVISLSIAAFCIGCVSEVVKVGHAGKHFAYLDHGVSAQTRHRMQQVGLLLGMTAFFVFWSMIYASGGPSIVFASRKPFLSSPIASGYYRELTMLSYPAAILIAGAWQGQRMTPGRILLLLTVASPDIIWGTLGGRRGNIFLSLCVLGLCWCIIRSRRPNLRWTIAALGAVGLVILLLSGNRSGLFQPWEHDIDVTIVESRLRGGGISEGDEYACAAAMIISSHELQRHYWGKRYVTLLFVRPIPKQVWPTKYEDMGLRWMQNQPGSAGLSANEWRSTVGFVPAAGSATGFPSDLFLEFSWMGLIFCFLLGKLYGWGWKRWVTRGGVWAIIYFEMIAFSAHLASQSVGAFLYRFLFMAIPTYFLWRQIIRPRTRRTRRRSIPANRQDMARQTPHHTDLKPRQIHPAANE